MYILKGKDLQIKPGNKGVEVNVGVKSYSKTGIFYTYITLLYYIIIILYLIIYDTIYNHCYVTYNYI